MRAAILRDGKMVVEDLDDLEPGPGQVLVEPIACGICGSDLHTVDHAHDMVATAHAAGVSNFAFDSDKPPTAGYSTQMLLSPDALLPIPNGLDPTVAALTERWRSACTQ